MSRKYNSNSPGTPAKKMMRLMASFGTTAVLAMFVFAGAGLALAATEPVISNITSTPTATGATIGWNTDENANAQVFYGTSTTYTASTTLTSGYSTSTQSVTLSGLTPDTQYHYAVLSADANGNINTSSDNTFMTLMAPTGTLTTNVATGTPGSTFTLSGSGYGLSEPVTITGFNGATSSVMSDGNGNFSMMFTVPTSTVTTSTPVTFSAVGGTSATNGSVVFTIVPATATSTTSTIALNPMSGDPGSLFSVTGSGFTPNETVTIDFNGTTSTAMADGNGNVSTTFTVPAGAMNGNVWVTATGETSNSVAGQWFAVTNAANNSSTTQQISMLQNEISQLQAIVNQLVTEVESLLNGNGGNGNNGGGSTMSATIDPVGSVRAGTSVDFGGRNWAPNEQVQVKDSNGNVVATAQADDGGNFSTGSLPVGSATGTMTYTFTGLTSGITRTATVTVTP